MPDEIMPASPELSFDVQIDVVGFGVCDSNVVDGWAVCRDRRVDSYFLVVHVASRRTGNVAALNIDDALSLRARYSERLGPAYEFGGKGSDSSIHALRVFRGWATEVPGRAERAMFAGVVVQEGSE